MKPLRSFPRVVRILVLTGALVPPLLVAGCGQKGGGAPAGATWQRVGPWKVASSNSPNPAHVGDNTITVAVQDSLGKPMHGSVELAVSMPAMGAMPYMESRAKVSPAGAGTFRANYGLSMNGEWDVTVRLLPESGSPVEAQYRLSTSIRGLSFVGGTPAAGGGSAPMPTGMAMPAAGDSTAGAIMLEAARRQSLGIRTEAVQVRDLSTSIRVPGRVAYDESHQAEVTMKFNGYVRELAASVTGQPVRRGQVLFGVYSPELWSAQQEYLEATRAAQSDRSHPELKTSSDELAEASRMRLALWDLSAEDIAAIARAGKPRQSLPIRSPVSGVVTEKNVVAGSAFSAGQVLFRIARLDPIWVIASVQQADLGLLHTGMRALVRDPYSDGRARAGQVSFLFPSLDSTTRTGEIRVALPNPGGELQPGRFVDVELDTPPLRRLAVPASAVLPTGKRAVVFVDLGDGRLAPREVQLGRQAGEYYEVFGGLRAGEVVVTSGNFLVGAESKLRSAGQKW